MTKHEALEMGELIVLIDHEAKPRPNFPEQVAVRLKGYAKRLHRYAETACNYSLTEAQERRVAQLEQHVRTLCKELGIGVKFNGDPRGFAVKLLLPSGRYNTWGGKEEGWGI